MNNVPHRIGGILRGGTLCALPGTHLTRLHAATGLDAAYQDASLKLDVAAGFPSGGTGATVHFRLTSIGADLNGGSRFLGLVARVRIDGSANPR